MCVRVCVCLCVCVGICHLPGTFKCVCGGVVGVDEVCHLPWPIQIAPVAIPPLINPHTHTLKKKLAVLAC